MYRCGGSAVQQGFFQGTITTGGNIQGDTIVFLLGNAQAQNISQSAGNTDPTTSAAQIVANGLIGQTFKASTQAGAFIIACIAEFGIWFSHYNGSPSSIPADVVTVQDILNIAGVQVGNRVRAPTAVVTFGSELTNYTDAASALASALSFGLPIADSIGMAGGAIRYGYLLRVQSIPGAPTVYFADGNAVYGLP